MPGARRTPPRPLGPPVFDPRPRLKIIRADHERKLAFVVVSQSPVAYGLHWAAGTPYGVLCRGRWEDCDLCQSGRRRSPTYWLAVQAVRNGPVKSLEIPTVAAEFCPALFDGSRSLRGLGLTVYRLHPWPKAPVRVVLGAALPAWPLPEEPDLAAAVQRHYGEPNPAAEGGGQ